MRLGGSDLDNPFAARHFRFLKEMSDNRVIPEILSTEPVKVFTRNHMDISMITQRRAPGGNIESLFNTESLEGGNYFFKNS